MRFDPNVIITHEQMVTMLNRYLEYKKYGLNNATSVGTVKYTDMSNLNDWSLNAVKEFADKLILNSRADGTGFVFKPQQKATRAEMAAVLARFISCINNETAADNIPITSTGYSSSIIDSYID